MKSFNDTNVGVAYVFRFEPHSKIAEYIICKEYDEVYWSDNVFREFQKRIMEKQNHLLSFYEKLEIEVSNYSKLYYSFNQFKSFADNFKYSDFKHEKDVMASLEQFWNYYFQHSTDCVIENMIESLKDFNSFLKSIVFKRMSFCESSYINCDDLHKRKEVYSDLRDVLDKNGVHDEDIDIVLDAYDFSKTLTFPLDFISFDNDCCNGVLKSNLGFNKVKCLKDYEYLT